MQVEKILNQLKTWAWEFAPKVAIAIVTLIIGLWLIKRLSSLIMKAMIKRDINISLQLFLRSLVSVGLKVILFVNVAGILGFQSSSLVAILGAAGLAIGLALQGSLSNFAGGVLILIFKPFKVGDIIEAQGVRGEVTEIQIFNTILLMPDLQTVILPNGVLSNGTIINFSKNGVVRVDLNLKISGVHNFEEVKTNTLQVLKTNSDILQTPAPDVFILSFIEGGYHVVVRPYTTPDKYWKVIDETNLLLLEMVQKLGINGPVISRHITNVNEQN